ncbi:MAG TPA: choice-of-anchor A family protein [Opitutaceae bacterium]|nr:choice-of-anchor A family protein [Opitutaceae bacterium]
MRNTTRLILSAGAAIFFAVVGRATLVDQALVRFDTNVRNYNLVSLGDASFSQYGDTEGGLAVAGNLFLQGGAVANRPELFKPTGDPTLYLGGALTVDGYVDLSSGYAALSAANNAPWSWNGGNARLTSAGSTLSTINTPDPFGDLDPRTNPGPASWNFASLASSFANISQTLAGATANGSVLFDGQTLKFAASSPAAQGVIVIDFDASLLVGNTYAGEMFSTVQFDVPSDSAYVINVRNAAGRTLFGSNSVNFNSGSGYEHLLWNIVDSTEDVTENVYFGDHGEFYGAVLAPTFNVFADSVSLNGQVVAGSYRHNQQGGEQRELHFTAFDYGYEVPEPATYGLLGAASCVGMMLWRRRHRAVQ